MSVCLRRRFADLACRGLQATLPASLQSWRWAVRCETAGIPDDTKALLFTLATERFAGRFRIGAGRYGATSETDGIAVAPGDFGPSYLGGLFVAQDGDNAPAAQNFKLVP